MTDAPDRQRVELLLAVAQLTDLADLLRWLEPLTRGAATNEWHIVSAAIQVVHDRRRDVNRQLLELDRVAGDAACLDG
jgi:hypothetical protein